MYHAWGTERLHTGVWWEDNMKMNLQEVGWRGMDRTGLVQKRDKWRAGTCKRGDKPSGSIKFGEFLD
jgi:hypothetical protein